MDADRRKQREFRAGPFLLDTETMRLTRSGRPVELGGRPLRLLAMLLENPGRVVTREEIKRTLWAYAKRIDTEARLNTAVRMLREALGDNATDPRFVETIRGRGYRWMGSERSSFGLFNWRRGLIAAAILLMTLVGSAASPTLLPLNAGDRAVFVRAVAQADHDREAAMADLSTVIASRPDFRPARLLRAELAISMWREDMTSDYVEIARVDLESAQPPTGVDPSVDALAAGLVLSADWDWDEAERLFRRALSNDPDHFDALHGIAWLYVDSGREGEAWEMLSRLLQSADLSSAQRADIGWLLLRLESNALAAAMCGDLADGHINLLSCRHTALARQGRIEEARDGAIALLTALGAEPDIIADVNAGPAHIGYQRFLDWRVTNLAESQQSWFQRAQLEAEAGRKGRALVSLEHAFAVRDPLMVKIGSTREFASISASPRFQFMLRAVRG